MLDPIIYREPENTSDLTEVATEVGRVEGTLIDQTDGLIPIPEGYTPTPLQDGEQTVNSGYFLQTDDEIVSIQSNIVLPSGLRAYNESGGNTYVEYLTASLTPIPEVSKEQQTLIYNGFGSLFVGFALILSFGFLVVNLFHLLSFRGTK